MRVFEDDATAVTIGDMTIENGTEVVRVFGELNISKDRRSVEWLKALEGQVAAMLRYLEAEADLPDVATPAGPTVAIDTVGNPF